MTVCCSGWNGTQLGKQNTGELLQRSLSAARSINNAAGLRKVASSLVTRVTKFIHADGGHFEQLV